MGLRLGVDIGGTFTDLALVDEDSGQQTTFKVSSTPSDYSAAVVNAIKALSTEHGIAPSSLTFLSHATTVVTNAILESKGARAALITTDGFRDVLEIRRQSRAKLYDIFQPPPQVIIPRHLRLEVSERVDAYGDVYKPLDESELLPIVAFLKAHEVKAIAVSLLFSFLNPVHEQAIGKILRRELPEVRTFLSSEVLPEMREYERTSTVAVCAYVAPVLEGYLNRLNEFLATDDYPPLYLTGSSGGVFNVDEGLRVPAMLTESGPAAGVTASVALGNVLGLNQLISFDMGGTTAKASLISNGEVSVTTEYEVGGSGNVRRWLQGTGYPIKVPVVDLAEVSAGGGSIAWLDDAGGLRVGPQSAGAAPGPACYGLGGQDPTVTDADAVLGYLDPGHFLGGRMPLSLDGASTAIQRIVGEPLGLDPMQAAQGIVDIVNSNMADAIRMISIERGHDPRDYSLVAFGGAGPVHAGRIGEELGIKKVIIPPNPGVFSAMGLVCTDLKRDYVRSLYTLLDAAGVDDRMRQVYRDITAEARDMLSRSGIPEENWLFRYYLDIRYGNQAYELTVPVESSEIDEGALDAIAERYHAQHFTTYDYNAPDEPIQLVNMRASAIGKFGADFIATRTSSTNGSKNISPRSHREVYFKESGQISCPVYDRGDLSAGAEIEGPAVIQESSSTVIVYPGQWAAATEFGTIEITV